MSASGVQHNDSMSVYVFYKVITVRLVNHSYLRHHTQLQNSNFSVYAAKVSTLLHLV